MQTPMFVFFNNDDKMPRREEKYPLEGRGKRGNTIKKTIIPIPRLGWEKKIFRKF